MKRLLAFWAAFMAVVPTPLIAFAEESGFAKKVEKAFWDQMKDKVLSFIDNTLTPIFAVSETVQMAWIVLTVCLALTFVKLLNKSWRAMIGIVLVSATLGGLCAHILATSPYGPWFAWSAVILPVLARWKSIRTLVKHFNLSTMWKLCKGEDIGEATETPDQPPARALCPQCRNRTLEGRFCTSCGYDSVPPPAPQPAPQPATPAAPTSPSSTPSSTPAEPAPTQHSSAVKWMDEF